METLQSRQTVHRRLSAKVVSAKARRAQLIDTCLLMPASDLRLATRACRVKSFRDALLPPRLIPGLTFTIKESERGCPFHLENHDATATKICHRCCRHT